MKLSTYSTSALLISLFSRVESSNLRRRLEDADKRDINVDVPGGIHVNVGGDGVAVTGPWGSTTVGENGVHVNGPDDDNHPGSGDEDDWHGHRPTHIGNTSCDNIGNYHVAGESSCHDALTQWYDAISAFDKASDRGREASMDKFCKTECGHTWTNNLFAKRLHCGDSDEDGSRDEPFRIHTYRDHVSVGKAEDTDEDNDRSGPSYPNDYPGLRLGCIKDSKDNQYCAIKRAALDKKPYTCDFYRSCCFANYNALIARVPSDFIDQVEEACPGARDAIRGDLCTA